MEDNYKTCSYCKVSKLATTDHFYHNSRGKGGWAAMCKCCQRLKASTPERKFKIKENRDRWQEENKEILKAKRSAKYNQNRAVIRTKQSEYYQSDVGKATRRAYQERPDVRERRREMQRILYPRRAEKKKQWYEANKHRQVGYRKKSAGKTQRRLYRKYSGRIRTALLLQKTSKNTSSTELLGCSIQELRDYMLSLFTDGMTWRDLEEGRIHIDHKQPCCSFDLSDPEQLKTCFHYTNLQPLWRIDNLRKRDEDRKISIQPQLKQILAASKATAIIPK